MNKKMNDLEKNLFWSNFIKDLVNGKKKYYAYCTMHNDWFSDERINFRFEKSEFREKYKKKDELIYEYDKLIMENNIRFHNKIGIYNFFRKDPKDIILNEGTIVIHDRFCILCKEKKIPKDYKNYLKKIEEKRKKERRKELERMFEELNTDNLGDYSFNELENLIIDLKEFINILKKKNEK